LPGVGVGPDLANSVIKIFDTINVPVKFDVIEKFTWDDSNLMKQLK